MHRPPDDKSFQMSSIWLPQSPPILLPIPYNELAAPHRGRAPQARFKIDAVESLLSNGRRSSKNVIEGFARGIFGI
jgi:hypothetical protein